MKPVAVLFGLAAFLAVPAGAAGPPNPGLPTDVQTVVRGNNAFALDLYARLRQTEGPLFCSPYSISTALAMTGAGARGETAAQMDKVLHFSLDPGRLHPAFGELIREINGRGLPRDYRLNVAQALWGDTFLPVRPEFRTLIRADYGARLRPAPFHDRPEEARRQINRWVGEQTNDRIKELLHKGDIDRTTGMVLVNAIYFKAAWDKPFTKAATADEDFEAAGKKVKAATMHQTASFNYAEGEGFQALELPYEGGELSMVVLLPREKDGLGKLEQSLTAAKLDACIGKLAGRQVAVALPRFKVEARFDLSEGLPAMGMRLAFSPEADFSGISTAEKLFISKVLHQAFVDVNEEGTEAAAATAVVMARGGPPERPVSFRADHPFLFLLRDNRTGSVLFLGRVTDPPAGAGAGR
jgi:serpin B